ncbi:hypothetical protein NFI96_026872, partial [Prochilodus magdalenae]
MQESTSAERAGEMFIQSTMILSGLQW